MLGIHFAFCINVVASSENVSSLNSMPFTVTADPPVCQDLTLLNQT